MSDITKSLKEIFDERISSPFYGSLIVSWLLWNWKISYVTFFVDGDILKEISKQSKLEYIMSNCNNIWHLLILPLLSTAIILLVLPYLTNGAYYITLKFDQWRVKKKNEIESSRLLSLEDSMKLRVEMQTLQEKYALMISDKEKEIEVLKARVSDLTKNKKKEQPVESISLESKRHLKEKEEFEEFIKSEHSDKFDSIMYQLTQGYTTLSDIEPKIRRVFVAFGIIEVDEKNKYRLSEKGKRFYTEYAKRSIKSK